MKSVLAYLKESRGLRFACGTGINHNTFPTNWGCQMPSTVSLDAGLGRFFYAKSPFTYASENPIFRCCDRPSAQTKLTAHSFMLRAGRPAPATLYTDDLASKFCQICTHTHTRNKYFCVLPPRSDFLVSSVAPGEYTKAFLVTGCWLMVTAPCGWQVLNEHQ